MSATTHLDLLSQRVELLDKCVTQLQREYTELREHLRKVLHNLEVYNDIRNELSVLASVQRAVINQESRISKLETPAKRDRSYADVVEQSDPVPFGSKEALIAQIESMFDCCAGDPRAWHTDYPSGNLYPYSVLGAISSGYNAPERLRQGLYTVLFKLKKTCASERPRLYWRHAVKESQEDNRHKITVRIAVPEADLSVAGPWLQHEGYTFVRVP